MNLLMTLNAYHVIYDIFILIILLFFVIVFSQDLFNLKIQMLVI
jgi:hypothetical protein